MKTKVKQYVEFLLGIHSSPNLIMEVKDRSEPREFPYDCLGYRFFEICESDSEEVLTGNRTNFSGRYIFGTPTNLAKIKKDRDNDNSILIDNMERNGWNRGVITPSGYYIPLNKKDKVIPEERLDEKANRSLGYKLAELPCNNPYNQKC
ncbi:MAG TPA: hypothetical protein P5277_00370 [Candidatus Paceibacterota bacterium]|nr:hypothetical protein [Candidatus Paceibacterota bacterium]